VLAAVYGIFSLGLQLNVGGTGVLNFGQAGFMAVGAYAMAILVTTEGLSFWIAWPLATLITALVAAAIGFSTLRLRADYLAIATISFSEIIRYVAENARGLTGGNQGLLGYDGAWQPVSNWLSARFADVGLGHDYLLPLAVVSWIAFAAFALLLTVLKRTPWGRVMRAIREDEDAARALGKNVLARKLQSLMIAAALAAFAGYLLALEVTILVPDEFVSTYTFIGFATVILAGVGSYIGLAVSTTILWVLLEATRYINLPLSADRVAAVRFIVVGVVLVLLLVFRPQGLFGNREEMTLRD